MNINSILDVKTPTEDVESYLPDAEKIINGQPKQRVWNLMSSKDERFHSGIWDSQAGHWKVSYSEDEYCHILEGESIIHDDEGTHKIVKAGDHFLIPAGFKGSWEVPSYCKKIYVIYE
ncbi:MAG: cupin domain-containing protein [Natronospirillum sp.]